MNKNWHKDTKHGLIIASMEIQTMSYPAKAIANYFIRRAAKEGDESLTLMKLLKLIYIAHGWNLAIFDTPLITEAIEAWKYGPVIAHVYHALKHFGIRDIDTPIEEHIYKDNGVIVTESYADNFDESTKNLLDKVWESHKNVTGIQLSNWSHHEEGPWYETWHSADNAKNQYQLPGIGIPDAKIKEYFKKLEIENERRQIQ